MNMSHGLHSKSKWNLFSQLKSDADLLVDNFHSST